MKKNLLSLIFLSIGLIVKSQTLELYTENNVLLVNGDTISIDSVSTSLDSLSFNEMTVKLNVKNTETVSKSVICKKQYIDTVAGTDNTFCWAGSCWPEATLVSPPQPIDSGATNSEFSGHYDPKNNIGTSIITYIFKVWHSDDSSWVNVKYNANYSGISNNSFSSSISAPYPNPANNNFSINYNILNKNNANILIYNVYGKLEKQISINNLIGVININVSDLPSGIYFCTFNINGEIVKTNKLIIVH